MCSWKQEQKELLLTITSIKCEDELEKRIKNKFNATQFQHSVTWSKKQTIIHRRTIIQERSKSWKEYISRNNNKRKQKMKHWFVFANLLAWIQNWETNILSMLSTSNRMKMKEWWMNRGRVMGIQYSRFLEILPRCFIRLRINHIKLFLFFANVIELIMVVSCKTSPNFHWIPITRVRLTCSEIQFLFCELIARVIYTLVAFQFLLLLFSSQSTKMNDPTNDLNRVMKIVIDVKTQIYMNHWEDR